MLAVKARYREKHREKLRQESREYQATRRAAEPEYAERDRERIRRLGRENPEYLSAIRRRSYAKHAEKRRRESSEQKLIRRQAIWERDGRLCHLCLHPVEWCDLEIDHVIPRSRGGGNEPTNLAASHRACNRRKAARLEMTSG
jgi:5-methylcytosine-specific restriction endonuclease McrA